MTDQEAPAPTVMVSCGGLHALHGGDVCRCTHYERSNAFNLAVIQTRHGCGYADCGDGISGKIEYGRGNAANAPFVFFVIHCIAALTDMSHLQLHPLIVGDGFFCVLYDFGLVPDILRLIFWKHCHDCFSETGAIHGAAQTNL